MPDQHEFNHLPWWGQITVQCIACGDKGPLSEWPLRRRRAHFERHEKERARAAADRRRAALAIAREAKRQKEEA